MKTIKGEPGSPGPGPAKLAEVGDGVFAYIQPDGSWYINNTGFVVGDSTVVAIDACSTERRTRALREQIGAVTSAPVSVLVNTHHHSDHTNGNSFMGAATIVGHENCRDELIKTGLRGDYGVWDPVDWGNVTVTPPTITFRDSLRLWSDDRPIDVTHVGVPAHTTGDSLVWLPEQRVLFCGDLLFNGGTPFALQGSVRGTIDVLTQVVAPVPAEVIVPGHGAPCDAGLIDDVVGYLRFVLDLARAGLDAGLTPLELARDTDLGDYAGWLDSERIVANLHRAYHDLDPSAPNLDTMTALHDMVEFNGGPLSCYA
jgi:cyclase